MRVSLINSNALNIPLADNSVHCVVTSPPYYSLRNYQVEGQLGLEDNLQEYIDNTIRWAAEVHRVLRDDGVFFLNLGDSYFGSNKGFMADGSQVGGKKQATNKGSVSIGKKVNAQRVNAYGTSGKEPVNYQGRGCLCENLCGVCREVYHRKSHTYASLDPMLVASLSLTNQEHKGFENDHFPTSDYSRLENHIFPAILGLLSSQDRASVPPPALLESMPDEFSRLLLDECWRRGSSSLCLLCARSLVYEFQGSVHSVPSGHSGNPEGNQDKTSGGVLLGNHNQNKDKACECCDGTYPHYTITSHLKTKDLMLVPHRVAIALQEWGWWVRSDIVWHKPNPMPESVTDRPTKVHEYIFLLTKNKNYYYDADAIREENVNPKRTNYQSGSRSFGENKDRNDNDLGERSKEFTASGRNKRTVWTITTKPYSGAHFATFPPELPEICINAGTSEKGVCPVCGSQWERVVVNTPGVSKDCPKTLSSHLARGGEGVPTGTVGKSGSGRTNNIRESTGWKPTCSCCRICDHFNLLHGEKKCPQPYEPVPPTVLDNFGGSGTTAMVANQLGRHGISLDLSWEYLQLAKKRTGITGLQEWESGRKAEVNLEGLPMFEDTL